MRRMDDDRTLLVPAAPPAADRGGVADCVTLFRDDSDDTVAEHRWRPLGDVRVGDGLWALLDRRPEEPHSPGDDAGPAHRYLIGRQIGRGGMGVVFEGWDAQLQRSVAIKLMDQSRQARRAGLLWFFREARIASQLRHPGIVAIHEFDLTPQGQPFIVMQLLTGRTLKEILAGSPDRAADLPGLLAIFLQVCQAVASAHGAGVIHRDLKPSNIMVGRFGVVTLMDWGMAQVLGTEDGSPAGRPAAERPPTTAADETTIRQTVAGTVCGTPAYLAPEQARGDARCGDRHADVFGLGAILCELLTGRPPFAADSAEASWAMAAAGDLAAALERLDACDGPAAMVRLAKACLAADPAARPDDAGAVVVAVTDYLEAGQRRAEQQLVRFFDLSLDLFCIAGLNGYLRRVNDNFPGRLGYSVEELKSRRFLEFVHPEDRDRTAAEVGRLARGEPAIQFVNRYRHADGHHLWLEWTARAVPEEAAIYAVARDVTDRVAASEARRRLEVSLEKSRQELVDFTENANVALHWVDGDGMIVWANQAELDFLGYSRDEYVGSPIARYHADQDAIADILARLERREALVGREARLVAKDGSLRQVAIYSTAYTEDGRFGHSRCFTIDISHQKRIEAMARERETLATFTAAAGLFLTAAGSLRERLEHVAAEAVAQLDLAGVQVWGWDDRSTTLRLMAEAGAAVAPGAAREGLPAAAAGPIGRIALDRRPAHLLDTDGCWEGFAAGGVSAHGIRSFVGYPLLVGDRLVGVLAVYAPRAVSDLLITALSGVVASLSLAIDLGEHPDG